MFKSLILFSVDSNLLSHPFIEYFLPETIFLFLQAFFLPQICLF